MRAQGGRRRGFLQNSQREADAGSTIFAVVMAWPVWRWVWSAQWTSRPPTVVGRALRPTVRG